MLKGTAAKTGEVQQLADGLTDLIHFADQQCIAEVIWEGYVPMLLSLLLELGIDTSREMQSKSPDIFQRLSGEF